MILDSLERAEDAGADLAAFPELSISGYPPEDLLLKPSFVTDGLDALDLIAARTGACAAIVGFVDNAGHGADRPLANAAALCVGGRLVSTYHKRMLPNYG